MADRNTSEYFTSTVIFGAGVRKISIPELSRKTAIHHNTLYGWRKHPGTMNLDAFRRIARATGMTDEQIVRAVRGLK